MRVKKGESCVWAGQFRATLTRYFQTPLKSRRIDVLVFMCVYQCVRKLNLLIILCSKNFSFKWNRKYGCFYLSFFCGSKQMQSNTILFSYENSTEFSPSLAQRSNWNVQNVLFSILVCQRKCVICALQMVPYGYIICCAYHYCAAGFLRTIYQCNQKCVKQQFSKRRHRNLKQDCTTYWVLHGNARHQHTKKKSMYRNYTYILYYC